MKLSLLYTKSSTLNYEASLIRFDSNQHPNLVIAKVCDEKTINLDLDFRR